MSVTKQRHRLCGKCGKFVWPWIGGRKCDGWYWHKLCWLVFWMGKEGASP